MDLSKIIKLYDGQHKEIPLIPGLPVGMEKFHIEGADECYAKLDEDNIMFFRSVDFEESESGICLSNYCFNGQTTIFAYTDHHTLEIHSMLNGIAQFRMEGGPWRRIIEGCYNGIYAAKVDNEAFFKGAAETFDIQIPLERLFKLAKQYPILRTFADTVKTGSNADLFYEFAYNSMKSYLMMAQIAGLLERKGKCLEAKKAIEELEAELILNRKEISKYRFSYENIKRISDVRERLTERMHETDILEKEERDSLMGIDKFREGFRILFHNTPKRFLLNARMETAKSLIDAGYELYQICERTGYTEPKRLEEAFKDHFRCTIKTYRNRLH